VGPKESLSEQVIETLADFLKVQMPILREVYEDFPNPDERIKVPSASILTLNPVFEAEKNPFEIEIPVPDSNNEFEIKWVVGNYQFPLQLDLWGASKKERHELFEDAFFALNQNVEPQGINLKMNGYFGLTAHYFITNYRLSDTEGASQRRERRATIEMTADTLGVVEKKEFAIVSTMVNDTGEVNITEEDIQ